MAFQLKIIGPRGEDILLTLCDNEDQMGRITVQQLKKKIALGLRTTDDLRLIFRTEPLEDSALLTSYGIRHMSTIHTTLQVDGGF